MSRYATTDQIQARFPAIFNTDRTCRRHLKQLVDMGYLSCADVKSTGVGWPNVYLCTIKGTKYLRESFELELPNAREEAKSLASIEHELFLTEFDLACLQTIAKNPELSILYQERRYFHQDKRLVFKTQEGSTKHLIPDGGLMLRVTRGEQTGYLQYFIELDNGTELPSVVLAKFNTYASWLASVAGQKYLRELYTRFGSSKPKPIFRLMVIARRQGLAGTDQKRLADLFAQALLVPPHLSQRMYFTTVDVLKTHQQADPPLAGKLWLRVKDATDWQEDFQQLVRSLKSAKGSGATKHKREFVLERIPHLPRHAMFPQ